MPGSAADWMRDGGVDEVAGDHALALGAERHRRLAGQHARAGRSVGARARRATRRDEVERGADGALGVVLVRDRRAPDRHHRVADELLDRAAVALDQPRGRCRSSARAARACPRRRGSPTRREADEVGEEDGDEPALGAPGAGGRRRGARPSARRAPPRTRRRTASPGSPGRPFGQTSGRAARRTRRRTSRRRGSRAPQPAQVMRSTPAGRRVAGPLEPRRRPEPLEDLARLGERALSLAGRLAVLEQGDCEPERELELAEERRGGPVAGLVAGQLRAEPVGVRLEQRRTLARPKRLDLAEQLLDLRRRRRARRPPRAPRRGRASRQERRRRTRPDATPARRGERLLRPALRPQHVRLGEDA